jgi:hypothetical protein
MTAEHRPVSAFKKRLRIPLIAIALFGAVTLGTTSCTSAPNGLAAAPNAKTTASPTPAPAATSNAEHFGDAIANGSVTDELGTYEKTTIDPNSLAMKLSPASVGVRGTFSDAELESAQQFVAKFVAEEATDSIALDSASGWATWLSKTADVYFLATDKKNMINSVPNDLTRNLSPDKPPAVLKPLRSNVIDNNTYGYDPVLIRDGKPRFISKTISVEKVFSVSENNDDFVNIQGRVKTAYRTTGPVAFAWLRATYPGATDAEINEKLPGIKTPGTVFRYLKSFDFTYAVIKSGKSWMITGFNTGAIGEIAINGN